MSGSVSTRSPTDSGLKRALESALADLEHAFERAPKEIPLEEIGTVTHLGHGIARVRGLPGVRAQELLRFQGGVTGVAFNLEPDVIGAVLHGESSRLGAGTEVRRTHHVESAPVGDSLLGRVVSPAGRPLDGHGPVRATEWRAVEREAPPIMARAPVSVPLQTGMKVVDALIPIGRGQRELILGDRQTGKTALAIDTILNQHDKDVLCIYCGIGKRSSALAGVVADLKKNGATDYSIVVAATEEDPPGLQFIAPYAATTMAEFFMESGRDVLVVLDDLTRHARAYRELSLLLRRPPGREAYPGDVFYIHSRLLERYTHLRDERGGGSLTALPIIETEAEDLSAYIPTNLISITDGQIYLSPRLFQKGVLPAVDVGKSVSRVGGKTQFPAYRRVAGDLRLAYSQFEELEAFSRFGTRLDEETRKTLDRGRRVREILKQPQYAPLDAAEQVAVLLALNRGGLDTVDIEEIGEVERHVRRRVLEALPSLCERIREGEELTEDDATALENEALQAIEERGER